MNARSRLATSILLIWVGTLFACGEPEDATGTERAHETSAKRTTDEIVAALGSAARTVGVVATDEWTWTQVELDDDFVPLRVDILVSRNGDDRRVLYMLPGSATSFESNYFTPRDHNLAHYMREQGYVVIGISSRGLSLAPGAPDDARVAGWGMARLREDAHDVITKLQRVLPGPVDLLGHSLGALVALDYAATYPSVPQKLFLIDHPGAYDPAAEPGLVARAKATTDYYQAQIDDGVLSLDVIGPILAPIAMALDPATANEPSPYSRAPLEGNFTWAGLAHFMLLNTGSLPGEGLWIAKQLCAGTYVFDPGDPQGDQFSLSHGDLAVLGAALAASPGRLPVAQWRDAFSAMAGDGRYVIPFANIRAQVSWVNAALGMGDHPYTAELIKAGGNRQVRFSVVEGYGHLDAISGGNAEADFWRVVTRDSL